MVTMDLKGLTWVGNVYQKLEAMCLEVEEVMYQDTVKYVENQVQTVGASVKKFYSDVMQDFLPLSSTDPVNEAAASNLPVEQVTDVGIYRKMKLSMKGETLEVDNEQLTDDSRATVDMDKDASHGAFFHGFDIEDTSCQPSSGNTVKGACSDLHSKEHDNRTHKKSSLGMQKTSKEENLSLSDMFGAISHTEKDQPSFGSNVKGACSDFYSKEHDNKIRKRSSLGLKKISKEENFSLSEMFGAVSHTEKDWSRASSFYALSDKNQEALCDQIDINRVPVTVEASGCNYKEETCYEFENESRESPGVLTDSESCNEIENASVNSSYNGITSEINAADVCTNKGTGSLAESPLIRDEQQHKFPDKVILVCRPGQPDELTRDSIESSIGVEQEMKTIQQTDDIQVEESCVVVNGDELYFVSCKEQKHRPYKKKIRDALSSRMRSGRKQEYEKLTVQYGKGVNSHKKCAESLIPTTSMEDLKRLPCHNLCESEWELL